MKYLKRYKLYESSKDFNDVSLIQSLVISDLDGMYDDDTEVNDMIEFEKCKYTPSPYNTGKPLFIKNNYLEKTDTWGPLRTSKLIWKDVYYSTTLVHWNGEDGGERTHQPKNGIEGVLLKYKSCSISEQSTYFKLSREIMKWINIDRMDQYGIGYCINLHNSIGDTILFYKL